MEVNSNRTYLQEFMAKALILYAANFWSLSRHKFFYLSLNDSCYIFSDNGDLVSTISHGEEICFYDPSNLNFYYIWRKNIWNKLGVGDEDALVNSLLINDKMPYTFYDDKSEGG